MSTVRANSITNAAGSGAPDFPNGLSVADGSAAAPSITNTDDTNTGIFFPAADTIAFAEGGVESMRITSAGDVGIGTSSPSTYGHGGTNKLVEVRNTGTTLNSQAHCIVSSDCTLAGTSVGTFTWALPSISATEKMVGYVGMVTEAGHTSALPKTAISISTRDGVAPPVERVRIDSSGNLLVGTTSNPNSARLNVLADGLNAPVSVQVPITGAYTNIFFRNPNGNVGSITTSGSSTSYATSSDYRLKENVAPMQNALDTVAQLNPVTYTWKADGSAGQGFIAHELQAVVPDCVTGEKDAVDETGNPQYQGVDTSFLVATLVKAIQELTARVAELEAK